MLLRFRDWIWNRKYSQKWRINRKNSKILHDNWFLGTLRTDWEKHRLKWVPSTQSGLHLSQKWHIYLRTPIDQVLPFQFGRGISILFIKADLRNFRVQSFGRNFEISEIRSLSNGRFHVVLLGLHRILCKHKGLFREVPGSPTRPARLETYLVSQDRKCIFLGVLISDKM